MYASMPIKITMPPPMPRKVRTVTFRLKDELYDILTQTARANGMTISSLVSYAMEDYLRIKPAAENVEDYTTEENQEE